MRFDVADAHVPARDADRRRDAQALTAQQYAGLAAGILGDFNVGPGNAAAPAGAEHLQYRFFGRESTGEVLVVSLGIRCAIRLLGGGETAVQESLAVLLGHPPDAGR